MKTPETRDRSLVSYLKEIAHSCPLSSEEEAELSLRIQKGDIEARNRLVQANLRFVLTIALEFRHRDMAMGELISAGNMGLLRAAELFDGNRGNRFVSYAVWWIRQAIHKCLREDRTVRIPDNRFGYMTRVSNSISNLQQRFNSEPDLEEIAEDLMVTVEQVERTMSDGRPPVSLDTGVDDSSALQDLEDPRPETLDEELDLVQLRQDLSDALDTLTHREAEILRLYYGFGHSRGYTLEEIGFRLGLTRERIRQIKERGLHKLRYAKRADRLKPYVEG